MLSAPVSGLAPSSAVPFLRTPEKGHLLLRLLLLLVVSFPIHSMAASSPSSPVVLTSHGRIRGKYVEFGGAKVDAFYGIPYAQPPVGQLRFEKPRPLEAWQGVLNATKLSPMAVPWVRPPNWEKPEVREQYSEDCLYLNVFRPQIRTDNETGDGIPAQLMPAMVIIHGGGFQRGSSRRYTNLEEIARKYLSRGIIAVTIEFRIGVFGYATSGKSNFASNLAYWDQTEALKWLQRNLAAFGGDPQRLTLFGYSSGSSSVGTLSVSPQSRDLFAQSIQMSGSVMMCRAASEGVVEETCKLAQALGCALGQDVKECLKGKTVEEIFEGVQKIGSTRVGLNYVKFGPRLDGDFLPADFPQLIAEARPKPTIIGIGEMEPLHFVLFGKNDSLHWDAIPLEEQATFGHDQFEQYIRRVVVRPSEFGDETDNLVQDLMNFYLGPSNGQKKEAQFYLERVVQVLADLQFVVPQALEVQARLELGHNTRLFAYINKYANGRWFPPEVPLHKAYHDNDHSYVFRNPAQVEYSFDAGDRLVESHWNELIANFVLTGDPSTPNLAWPPALAHSAFGEQPQLLMDWPPGPTISTAHSAVQRRVDFWARMIAKYPEYNLVMGRKGEPAGGADQQRGALNGDVGKRAAAAIFNGISAPVFSAFVLFIFFFSL